jgi:hypothetical protein
MDMNEEYAKSFGQLANIVTGFVVTEGLIVSLNVAGGGLFAHNVATRSVQASWGALAVNVLLALMVWRLYRAEKKLLLVSKEDRTLVLHERVSLLRAQIAAIAIVSAIVIMVIRIAIA